VLILWLYKNKIIITNKDFTLKQNHNKIDNILYIISSMYASTFWTINPTLVIVKCDRAWNKHSERPGIKKQRLLVFKHLFIVYKHSSFHFTYVSSCVSVYICVVHIASDLHRSPICCCCFGALYCWGYGCCNIILWP